MKGEQYTKAWLAIQSLLLISAVCGVKFSWFHGALAGACLVYNFCVWRALKRVKHGTDT